MLVTVTFFNHGIKIDHSPECADCFQIELDELRFVKLNIGYVLTTKDGRCLGRGTDTIVHAVNPQHLFIRSLRIDSNGNVSPVLLNSDDAEFNIVTDLNTISTAVRECSNCGDIFRNAFGYSLNRDGYQCIHCYNENESGHEVEEDELDEENDEEAGEEEGIPIRASLTDHFLNMGQSMRSIRRNCQHCGISFHDKLSVLKSNFFKNTCIECEALMLARGKGVLPYNFKPEKYTKHSLGETNPVFFGFEFEFEHIGDRITAMLFSQNKDKFFVKHDGSLNNGYEIVTQPMTEKYLKKNRWIIQKIFCMVPEYMHADAATCGLHCHISRTAFQNSLALFKALKFVNDNYGFFYRVSGRNDRSRFERYCTKTDDIKDSALRKVKEFTSETHHELFSLSSEETVELRSFGGTNSIERVYAILEFIVIFIKFINTSRRLTLPAFKKELSLSEIIMSDKIFSSCIK